MEFIKKVISRIKKIEPKWNNIFLDTIEDHLPKGRSISSILKIKLKELRKSEVACDLPKDAERSLRFSLKLMRFLTSGFNKNAFPLIEAH